MAEKNQGIGGITFTGAITVNGPMFDIHDNQHVHIHANAQKDEYTDEEVAKALVSIVGKDKPINSKARWAGALWWLRWGCNYPSSAREFCERIKKLPLPDGLDFRCEYDSIRRTARLSFMDEDPRHMDKVRYSEMDKQDFMQAREVALALEGALRRTRVAAD